MFAVFMWFLSCVIIAGYWHICCVLVQFLDVVINYLVFDNELLIGMPLLQSPFLQNICDLTFEL